MRKPRRMPGEERKKEVPKISGKRRRKKESGNGCRRQARREDYRVRTLNLLPRTRGIGESVTGMEGRRKKH